MAISHIDSAGAAELPIHHPRTDGGCAAFMRGLRDGIQVECDIAPVPADGGEPAEQILISRPSRGN